MTRKHFMQWGAVTAMAATVLWLVSVAPSPKPEVKHRVSVPSKETDASGLRGKHRSQAGETTEHADPRLSPWSAIAQYNAIRDGRPFVVEAVRHPERGGAFYASWVVDGCIAFRGLGFLELAQPSVEQVGVESFVSATRALDTMRARCDQLTDEELDTYSGRALAKSRLGKIDILNAAVNRLVVAKETAARDDAVAAIIDLGDPLVIDRLGLRMIARHGDQGGFLYYDGQKFPLNETVGITEALYLLPCELGLECGNEDPVMALQCVMAGACYADRSERVLKEFARGDVARFERIQTLAAAMAEAIRARDYGKFLSTR